MILEVKQTKKTPERTCAACGSKNSKLNFIRFVRRADGVVGVDFTNKEKGRGAYICANRACFEMAKKKNSLSRALRAKIEKTEYFELEKDFSDALSKAYAGGEH